MADFAHGVRKHPLPVVAQSKAVFRVLAEKDLPLSIGRLGITMDSAALVSAYFSVTVNK